MQAVFVEEIKNIYRIKIPFDNLYTSVFLIKTEQGSVLIDCATYASDVDGYILPGLKALGLAVADLRCLVLTHKHGDHAGGLKRLEEMCPHITVVDKPCELPGGLEIYPLFGHTSDCVGVFDACSGTLVSGDGLQGYGVGKYRCSLESKDEYAKTLDKIKNDERIQNMLFSHAYEPWYKDGAFGRATVEACLRDCESVIEE